MSSTAIFLALALAMLASVGSGLVFRPPAIPLITTDPYMQTWMMGDNSTSDLVRHWDQTVKEMAGIARIDGKPMWFLGLCSSPARPTKPGPAETTPKHDIAPGICDVANSPLKGEDDCNERCYGSRDCVAYVTSSSTCYLKSCTKPVVPRPDRTASVITGPKPANPSCAVPTMRQTSVSVGPTSTKFELEGGGITLTLSFVSTLFTDDYARLSRPVSYVVMEASSADGAPHDVELYFDMSGEHTVNEDLTEVVGWAAWQTPKAAPRVLSGLRIGTSAQNVLGTKGDKTNIDWGYLYVADAAGADGATSRAGAAADNRAAFVANGSLPAGPDPRNPRAAGDDMPVLSFVRKLSVTAAATPARHTLLVGYDDIASVYYFGSQFKGLWTRTWESIEQAMAAAAAELDESMTKSARVDAEIVAALTEAAGEEFAAIGALAYRQTLAATKLVWNHVNQTEWNFLKEISTNGDMQTMDVVYPASPMLLWADPNLLKLLLIPTLDFANNATCHAFTNPYSPHQIGTYPIANATTSSQEPMPMENTGNMFLMLLGIVQRTNQTDWLYPRYWPLLTTWADYLKATLPFPANQLCTDDFTGKLANNTNLAAKGIVALEAFSSLCDQVTGGSDACAAYKSAAAGFAETWVKFALENDPAPHYKIAYDVQNSYSLKYNLVWQKLLGLDGPFNWTQVVENEIPYYKSKANEYGVPLDMRHTYVKLDWLSWAAAMADTNEDFTLIFNPIFKMANETASRVPLTDLFDTVSAAASRAPKGFVARPVVGGVFAKVISRGATWRL